MRNGDYTLEIAYTGAGAPILTVPVRIGPAPWRFTLLAALAFVALAAVLRLVLRLERFERLQYRLQKFAFVLRRRLTGVNFRTEPTEPAIAELTGRTLLNRYEIQKAVAHGGFSTVYAAIDHLTGEKAAIKQLRSPLGKVRERFAKEVATLRSIRHPNVVPVIDSWIDANGEACLAMPFLDGPTLRDTLRESPVAPARTAQVVRGIGSALAEMHARGIVHRDLKPENVILAAVSAHETTPVLIDFGIATLYQGRDRSSATLTMAGSLQYMAPECLTGHYSTTTDVYSLSVMTLEMLTLKGSAIWKSDSMTLRSWNNCGAHSGGSSLNALRTLLPKSWRRPSIHRKTGRKRAVGLKESSACYRLRQAVSLPASHLTPKL